MKTHDLVVLNQLKNAIPNRVATYLTELQVKTVGEAAALGDQYVLTHCTDTGSVGGAAGGQTGSARSVRSGVNVLVEERG